MFSSFRQHQKATVRVVEAMKAGKAVKASNKAPPDFPFWLIIMCMIRRKITSWASSEENNPIDLNLHDCVK